MIHNDDGDERADAPVIGVVLLVGIAVILAAAVTAYVFGLSVFGFETVPQAQFTTEFSESGTLPGEGCSFDGSGGVLNITHNGGQTLDAETISIVVAGSGSEPWGECSGADTEIANRDSAHIQVASDAVVRVVWESKNEENSHTMVRWNGTAET